MLLHFLLLSHLIISQRLLPNLSLISSPSTFPSFFFPSWSGQYVILDVEFSLEACDIAQIKLKEMGYLSIFSLLKHENKLSVMHCNVQRNEQAGDTTVIRSKEELFFQVSYIFHILYLFFIFIWWFFVKIFTDL